MSSRCWRREIERLRGRDPIGLLLWRHAAVLEQQRLKSKVFQVQPSFYLNVFISATTCLRRAQPLVQSQPALAISLSRAANTETTPHSITTTTNQSSEFIRNCISTPPLLMQSDIMGAGHQMAPSSSIGRRCPVQWRCRWHWFWF